MKMTETLSTGQRPTLGETGGLPLQDDSPKDLKSYLTGLERNRLVVLASKYKIKVCRSGTKRQIVATFVNRVPSDMIELICAELEKESGKKHVYYDPRQPAQSSEGALS